MMNEIIFPFDQFGDSPALQYYNQGRALMQSGQFHEASILFLESCNLEPHFKTYELLGECYQNLNQFPISIPFLAASTLINNACRAPMLLAKSYYELKTYDLAIKYAELALARSPNANHNTNKIVLEIISSSHSELEKNGFKYSDGSDGRLSYI
jgi:tetratricopeptide (TPR) repeat protein